MKRAALLVFVVALGLSAGFGCSSAKKRTEPIPIPPAKAKGALDVVLTTSETLPKDDLTFLKNTFREDFEEAGYDPVSVGKKNGSGDTVVNIKVGKYETTSKNETGCVVASGACTYICLCAAPCFVIPRYFEVKVDLVADVSASRGNRLLFTERFQEESTSPANVVDSGAASMKNALRKTAVNNTVARIMQKLNEQ